MCIWKVLSLTILPGQQNLFYKIWSTVLFQLCSHDGGADKYLLCPAPPAQHHTRRKRQSGYTPTENQYIAFQMDRVQSVRNVSFYFPGVNSLVSIHPDPEYYDLNIDGEPFKFIPADESLLTLKVNN